jgi:hypothetical protein
MTLPKFRPEWMLQENRAGAVRPAAVNLGF